MLTIGHIPVDPPLILAPMAGVTDRDFRLIVRRIGGVALVTMEFINSKGLVRGDNVLLPGFASRDVARHPAFILTPPTRLVAPDRFGLARRMSPEGELTEWELHPAGKPVAHWCQASDFVDDPTG